MHVPRPCRPATLVPACGPTSHRPQTLRPTSLEFLSFPRGSQASQSQVPPSPALPFTAWRHWPQDPPQPAPARSQQDLGQLEHTVTQQWPADQSPAALPPQGARDSPGGSGLRKQPSLSEFQALQGAGGVPPASSLLVTSPAQPDTSM